MNLNVTNTIIISFVQMFVDLYGSFPTFEKNKYAKVFSIKIQFLTNFRNDLNCWFQILLINIGYYCDRLNLVDIYYE